jgi:hypothetical protein
MNNFNQFDNDFTPFGLLTMSISWMNILGLVNLNPLLQTVVYLLTICWLAMQMFAFAKKQFNKKS